MDTDVAAATAGATLQGGPSNGDQPPSTPTGAAAAALPDLARLDSMDASLQGLLSVVHALVDRLPSSSPAKVAPGTTPARANAQLAVVTQAGGVPLHQPQADLVRSNVMGWEGSVQHARQQQLRQMLNRLGSLLPPDHPTVTKANALGNALTCEDMIRDVVLRCADFVAASAGPSNLPMVSRRNEHQLVRVRRPSDILRSSAFLATPDQDEAASFLASHGLTVTRNGLSVPASDALQDLLSTALASGSAPRTEDLAVSTPLPVPACPWYCPLSCSVLFCSAHGTLAPLRHSCTLHPLALAAYIFFSAHGVFSFAPILHLAVACSHSCTWLSLALTLALAALDCTCCTVWHHYFHTSLQSLGSVLPLRISFTHSMCKQRPRAIARAYRHQALRCLKAPAAN